MSIDVSLVKTRACKKLQKVLAILKTLGITTNMGGAMKPRRKRKRLNTMKAMIIAFLTSPENYDSQSVTDAIHCFDVDEESIQEDLLQLGQKLESAFVQRAEVSVSEWIADEDIEAFDEMVAAYEAL